MRTVKIQSQRDILKIGHYEGVCVIRCIETFADAEIALLKPSQVRRAATALIKAAKEMEKEK